MTITTLSTYPSVSAAFNAITDLSARYKAQFKRVEKVGLFIASSGDPKTPTIEVRVHATAEQTDEAKWFVAAVS